MKKPSMRRIKRIIHDRTTRQAVVDVLTKHGGELPRRDLVRILGHRSDLAAALASLKRSKSIELLWIHSTQGKRAQARVRLIGRTAINSGAGFVKIRTN